MSVGATVFVRVEEKVLRDRFQGKGDHAGPKQQHPVARVSLWPGAESGDCTNLSAARNGHSAPVQGFRLFSNVRCGGGAALEAPDGKPHESGASSSRCAPATQRFLFSRLTKAKSLAPVQDLYRIFCLEPNAGVAESGAAVGDDPESPLRIGPDQRSTFCRLAPQRNSRSRSGGGPLVFRNLDRSPRTLRDSCPGESRFRCRF
jgi:hypothetical protein